MSALLPIVVVHCVWCTHVERGLDPYATGAQMETHYERKHRVRIDRIVGAAAAAPAGAEGGEQRG